MPLQVSYQSMSISLCLYSLTQDVVCSTKRWFRGFHPQILFLLVLWLLSCKRDTVLPVSSQTLTALPARCASGRSSVPSRKEGGKGSSITSGTGQSLPPFLPQKEVAPCCPMAKCSRWPFTAILSWKTWAGGSPAVGQQMGFGEQAKSARWRFAQLPAAPGHADRHVPSNRSVSPVPELSRAAS